VVMIECAFGFWQERRLTIDYHNCSRDDHEWSTVEFREWRARRDPCFVVDLSVPNPLDPRLPVDILSDCALEFRVRVKSTLRDLRECPKNSIRDRDCYRELLDATMEDYDEMGRTYEAELANLRAKLEQRSLVPSATEVECIQLRSRVTSLENELANLTQRFTILD